MFGKMSVGVLQRGASAENEDQDRQNDERIRPLQGYEDNRIHRRARADSAPTAYRVGGELQGRAAQWRLGEVIR